MFFIKNFYAQYFQYDTDIDTGADKKLTFQIITATISRLQQFKENR